MEEHRNHVMKIHFSLQKAGRYLKSEKCKFLVQQPKYLGFIISWKGICFDPGKVPTVQAWASANTVNEVQAFHGFANVYQRLIKDYF